MKNAISVIENESDRLFFAGSGIEPGSSVMRVDVQALLKPPNRRARLLFPNPRPEEIFFFLK